MNFPTIGSAGSTWSERNFRRLLAGERDLADRHGTPCSLVVLDTTATKKSQRRALLRHLNLRLRVSDSVGAFQGDLAILLRNTTRSSARHLVDDLGTWSAMWNIHIGHQILEYPESPDGPPSGPRPLLAPNVERSERKPSTSSGVHISSFESALVEDLSFPRRCLDVAVSLGGLVAISPVLCAVAAAIRIESKGPILYRQQRVGAGGKTFNILKFRSMHIGAEDQRAELEAANEKDGPIFKIKSDPRITKVGRLIRKLTLDELPQLWNVLRGDMTLVGPRPQKVDEVQQYEPWQRRRLSLPSGLTCIWQVSGRSNISFKDWMRMDCDYARRRDLIFDLSLLFRTVPALLTARGAY